MLYAWLKLIHILSSTILFGTGLGSAFYLYCADRSKNINAIVFAARKVVIADFIFTTPAVIIQPVTGFIMAAQAHYAITASWIMVSLFLYVLTGICWLPVVWLQIRIRDIAETALQAQNELPKLYYRYFNYWFWLGWPAFLSVIIIFYLMVFKPS